MARSNPTDKCIPWKLTSDRAVSYKSTKQCDIFKNILISQKVQNLTKIGSPMVSVSQCQASLQSWQCKPFFHFIRHDLDLTPQFLPVKYSIRKFCYLIIVERMVYLQNSSKRWIRWWGVSDTSWRQLKTFCSLILYSLLLEAIAESVAITPESNVQFPSTSFAFLSIFL